MIDERTHWLAERTSRVIVAAMDRDDDEVFRLVEEIGETQAHDGVFALCCGLSEAVRQFAFPGVPRGDGSLDGTMVAVRTKREPASRHDAASLWACRFLAAYINGDTDTQLALFHGGLDDRPQTLTNIAALITICGDVSRQREQEVNGGQG